MIGLINVGGLQCNGVVQELSEIKIRRFRGSLHSHVSLMKGSVDDAMVGEWSGICALHEGLVARRYR